MHLILVICDASIVNVLLCLKVNLCQIIKQTHSTSTLEVEMKGFHVAALIVKYEELSQCLGCYTISPQ